MSDFLVVGGGGHARVLIHALKHLGHHVCGYTALEDKDDVKMPPYLGTDDAITTRCSSLPTMAVLGVGKIQVQSPRLVLLETLEARGFRLPPIIARAATVHESVSVAAGTVVFDGAVVVTGSQLGRACIINTHATLDHDCVLGEDVHIATGANLSGGVVIGDRCMIGTGANVINGVRICADVLIGAGSTVVNDVTEPGIYVGCPARRIA